MQLPTNQYRSIATWSFLMTFQRYCRPSAENSHPGDPTRVPGKIWGCSPRLFDFGAPSAKTLG